MSDARDPADPHAIAAWAEQAAPALELRVDAPPVATRIGGGFSNLTFRLDWTTRDGAPRRAVLRRPPPDVVPQGGAHDMLREWRVLRAVHGSAVPVPTPLAACEDAAVLGAPFYLMAHVDGTIVRTLDDAPLLRDAGAMRRFAEATVDGLAALHALPVAAMPGFDQARAATYGARQVETWARRWTAARTSGIPDEPARGVFAWLASRATPCAAPALLHNDWKFDNLLVHADAPWQLHAVLDWEMATTGDPAYDLGTTLGYWMQPDDPAPLVRLALGITTAEGCLAREEVVARYEAARGERIADPVACWAFGLAKVAVIALQLHARHVAGRVRDDRYAPLGQVAVLLMQTADSAIRRDSLRAN
ncbi:MAG: phosphotransferase family protein [Gemmatimonadaceae bacterium]|nr:phosphotransferase family protein [Gemmatimonadaceae bacterium]